MSERLTLSQALSRGCLEDFVTQAEADGIGPADRAQFDALVGRVTAPSGSFACSGSTLLIRVSLSRERSA